jgi:hypothetical protein
LATIKLILNASSTRWKRIRSCADTSVGVRGQDTQRRAGPIFGVACALLAKEWGRRQWLWLVLGFFFTFIAVLALVFLKPLDAKAPE